MTPGGRPPSFSSASTHAGRERLARGRVVADRQRLPRPAEDHLLVGDEARQAHRVDRHVALHAAAAVAFAVPDGASSFVAWWSSTISAAVEVAPTPPRANRIISTAPIAKFGAKKTATPAARASLVHLGRVPAGRADNARHARRDRAADVRDDRRPAS